MADVFSNLSESLKENLTKLGITSPTPVQAEVIPRILSGENVLFESETGTGKTFAYLLPLINKLESLEDHQRVRRYQRSSCRPRSRKGKEGMAQARLPLHSYRPLRTGRGDLDRQYRRIRLLADARDVAPRRSGSSRWYREHQELGSKLRYVQAYRSRQG